jgi:isoleucyl-tRNA synthetase
MYANIDGWTYAEQPIPLRERPEIDRWILSALHSLVKEYHVAMERYDVTHAARAISDFTIDQLSNWYVRRNRKRFWSRWGTGGDSATSADKLAAYQTLYDCLLIISKLMAPFAPFTSEELYRNLNGATGKESCESVHLAFSPEPDDSNIDLALESRMKKAQRIVSLVRAMRNTSNIKVRQPLPRVIIPIMNESDRAALKSMEELILEEINVKAIEYVTDDSGIVRKSTKPNFKTLGPKHGKAVQAIAAAIKQLQPPQIKALETEGSIVLQLNGTDITVSREDVEILHDDITGWLVQADNELTVALDTSLSDELIHEGLARELVNRIQNMRKDAGFDVTDRITIFVSAEGRLTKALDAFGPYIQNETLAVGLTRAFEDGEFSADLDITGERCRIGIRREPGSTSR